MKLVFHTAPSAKKTALSTRLWLTVDTWFVGLASTGTGWPRSTTQATVLFVDRRMDLFCLSPWKVRHYPHMKDLPDNFTGSKRMSVEDSLAYGPRPKISRTMTANAPERQGILYIPKKLKRFLAYSRSGWISWGWSQKFRWTVLYLGGGMPIKVNSVFSWEIWSPLPGLRITSNSSQSHGWVPVPSLTELFTSPV